MPLTGIVTIVLRIFSLLWLVDGVIRIISAIQTAASPEIRSTSAWIFAVPIMYLLIALVVFVLSHPIARIATPPPNAEVNLGTLTQYDLYCFAFTFLGLYFFLSSVGSTINSLHFYMVTGQSVHQNAPDRLDAFYKLTRPLLTLIAGIATLLLAPRLARKLTALQQKNDAA